MNSAHKINMYLHFSRVLSNIGSKTAHSYARKQTVYLPRRHKREDLKLAVFCCLKLHGLGYSADLQYIVQVHACGATVLASD